MQGVRNFPHKVLDSTQPESKRIRRSDLRTLAGNGMHAAAVGTFSMFALGSVEFT